MIIQRTDDFELNGTGDAAEWERAEWFPLVAHSGPATYATRARLLYSQTGLYALFDCEDKRLTCTKTADFADLYREDVVELFLQPNPEQKYYLEYEISPLGMELPLLVGNAGGTLHGWLPFHYEGQRKTRRATHIRGGEKTPMSACEGWSAEVFIPFVLFSGMTPFPPTPGTLWRGNLCRIDYDTGTRAQWTWTEPATRGNFHDYPHFGTLEFA